MALITIQHGCGHERVIETPGPEDPQGLLSKLAETRGAVHRAPAKCSMCEPSDTAPSDEGAKQEEGLPSAADLDAVAAEQSLKEEISTEMGLRESKGVDPAMEFRDPNAPAPIDPGTPTGSLE